MRKKEFLAWEEYFRLIEAKDNLHFINQTSLQSMNNWRLR